MSENKTTSMDQEREAMTRKMIENLNTPDPEEEKNWEKIQKDMAKYRASKKL